MSAPLTVGSLFAGVGGFDVGFERAGFTVRWQAEVDGHAQKVLLARFPHARLFTDVRAVTADTAERVDVICGGFPCQDVSVAGKREGLAGARTGLFWEIVRIAGELRPSWMVLENVPGLLTSHSGRDFHTVLSALADCGFRREYRVLDSRYFGVPQRRRRVFLVLRARDARDGAGQVLFEPEGVRRRAKASGEAGARCAATLRGRSASRGVNPPGRGGEDDENIVMAFRSTDGLDIQVLRDQSPTLKVESGLGIPSPPAIFGTLNSGGNAGGFRTEPGEHLVAETTCGDYSRADDITLVAPPERARALVGSMHKRHDDDTDTLIPTLSASMGHHGHSSPRGDGIDALVPTLSSDGKRRPGGQPDDVESLRVARSGVRRLTPLECERLQGFPDGWTCLCGNGHRGSSFCSCPDSPRYKQMGNAVTVNVAEWIACRLMAAVVSAQSDVA